MGKKQDWIVVTEGTKPGVYKNWLRAWPYIKPVRGHAAYQGFSTEAEARQEFNFALAQRHVHVLGDPRISTVDMCPEGGDSEQYDTDPEPPTPSPRRSARLAMKEERGASSARGHKQEDSPQPATSGRTRKVSIGYPDDQWNAYVAPKEVRRTQSAHVGSSQKVSFPIRRENTSPTGTASPRSSTGSTNSTSSAYDTAASSHSADESDSESLNETGTAVQPLSPITSPHLSTTEDLSASSSHRSSIRTPRSSPLKKSTVQKQDSSFDSPQTPRTPRRRAPEEADAICLSPKDLRHVTLSRGSPSRRRSPQKLMTSEGTSLRATDPPSSLADGLALVNNFDVRSPLKKKQIKRDFYNSCSSSGRPSPQVAGLNLLFSKAAL